MFKNSARESKPFPVEEAKALYAEIYADAVGRGYTKGYARLLASSFSGHDEPQDGIKKYPKG